MLHLTEPYLDNLLANTRYEKGMYGCMVACQLVAGKPAITQILYIQSTFKHEDWFFLLETQVEIWNGAVEVAILYQWKM